MSESVDLLGQCLGHHGEFGKELVRCYPTHFSVFAGMDVVSALRNYLWRFRLPGEADQIGRVVEGFAQAYFLQNQPTKPIDVKTCVEPIAVGWYVKQPYTRTDVLCCAHCGTIEGESDNDLCVCEGCGIVHFCRKCSKRAHYCGHAVGGRIGYGRACVHARDQAGQLDMGGILTYKHMYGLPAAAKVQLDHVTWGKACPFKTEDSVMVLAYAIIMLSTNLHNANVKKKMEVHEFLRQNRDLNGGSNFPGDYLLDVYSSIKQEELKVMTA